MKDFVFYVALACLFTHELDAVPNHEWRLLPVLKTLPDSTGMWAFVAGHVPLIALVLAVVASLKPRMRSVSRRAVGGFACVHGLAHWLLMGDPAYEFASPLSNVLIFGAATCGAIFLVMEWKDASEV
ncbi:MAG: hypothetical protein GY944_15020 [bacterium]|nr:hypothetical protein [bacterium]